MNSLKHLLRLIIIIPVLSYAHAPNKAFFSISQNESNIVVDAELPWTFKDCLEEYFPHVIYMDHDGREEGIFQYISENLILRKKDGTQIALDSVIELPHRGHYHQMNYRFLYPREKLDSFENNLMFNINPDQHNFTRVNFTHQNTITSKKNLLFYIKNKKRKSDIYLWIFASILTLVVFGVGLFYKPKKSSQE